MRTRTITVELLHQPDGPESAPANRNAEFFRALDRGLPDATTRGVQWQKALPRSENLSTKLT